MRCHFASSRLANQHTEKAVFEYRWIWDDDMEWLRLPTGEEQISLLGVIGRSFSPKVISGECYRPNRRGRSVFQKRGRGPTQCRLNARRRERTLSRPDGLLHNGEQQ
jgi:hypothetical protein